MTKLTFDNAGAFFAAKEIVRPADYTAPTASPRVVADTRSVAEPSETLFVALRTGVDDGHRYIREAHEAGVRHFLVEQRECAALAPDSVFFVVDSVIDALRNAAREALEGLGCGIVVSGSYGKTKTKELIYRGLLGCCDVRRSPRSWNSGIGVPLAVLDMLGAEGTPGVIVTEVGIDGPGQAENITEMLAASHGIGVLTPVNTEHDGAFASHAAKVREKIRLVESCHTIVYDTSDPLVGTMLAEHSSARLVPVDSAAGASPFHALAKAVLEIVGFDAANADALPLADSRIDICDSVNGCTVVRDRFTPDLRTLCGTLDLMRRQGDATRPGVLVLGNLLHAPMTDKALAAIYNEAFDAASRYGIGEVLAVGDDMARIGHLLAPRTSCRIVPGQERYFASRINAGLELAQRRVLIFGTPASVAPYAEALDAATHDTTLEVDLDALVHNYNFYRSLLPPQTGMVAMVKASAYGMGAIEAGRTLQSHGAAYLAVAVIEEGVALREAGITMPIMVMNPITNRHQALFAHKLQPAVFSLAELRRLIDEARACGIARYPVHIKLDTGMHRVGFTEAMLPELADVLVASPEVEVVSVFSHLATADCLDMDAYTRGQLDLFFRLCDDLERRLGHTFKRHILNTAGMMRFADCGTYQMARLGIGLYGIAPFATAQAQCLKPVATLRTHIISLKHWPEGTPIGYGCKGRTSRPSVIATIPVGYADGINRHLGRGNAAFMVGGVPCPTIGNICMDQCMLDVTDAPGAEVGTAVEIFGPSLPVERLADALDTIPYEIITSISPRVRRTYTRR